MRDQYWALSGDQYSVLFHVFARGVTALPRGLHARLCQAFLVCSVSLFPQSRMPLYFTFTSRGIAFSSPLFSVSPIEHLLHKSCSSSAKFLYLRKWTYGKYTVIPRGVSVVGKREHEVATMSRRGCMRVKDCTSDFKVPHANARLHYVGLKRRSHRIITELNWTGSAQGQCMHMHRLHS